MARFEFKLPDIGEGVTEGEIVAWGDGIQVGARVEAEQTLAEVMTDKATVTIPSPKAGTVVELGGKVGDVIPVGGVLIVIETESRAQAADKAPTTPRPAERTAAQVVSPSEKAPELDRTAQGRLAPQSPAPSTPSKVQADGPSATAAGSIPEQLPGMADDEATGGASEMAERPLASPATRKLARELGVNLWAVSGTGPNGRVTQDDVRKMAHGGKGAPEAVPVRQPEAPPPVAVAPAAAAAREALAPVRIARPEGADDRREERVPLRGVRKKIFEQMARSKQTAAHFTFVEECDVTALKALRTRLRPLAEAQGVKLSYLPFIVKASVAALKKHPMLNAAFDETTQEIVVRRYYNVGMATATDAGLMVPVVKEVDAKSILDVAAEMQRLAEGARQGKLRREDLVGSTFTITSLGAVGGLFATPILNFPEVAILGVHQIKQKPVVRDGQIAIGEVMLLSLSFDHRIVDGHVGAAFAYEVIRYLENPDNLLLEMG